MPLLPGKMSYAEVGGTKVDYAPVVDPTTDRSAAEINNAFASAAALTRTSIRFWARFATDNSGDGYLAEANSWDSVWKTNSPSNPIIAHPSTGKYTVTLPTIVKDEQQNDQTLTFLTGWGQVEGDTFYHVQVSVTDGHVLTIHIFDDSNVLADLDDGSFSIFGV